LRRQNRDRAAGLLDRRDRRLRGPPDRKGGLGRELAGAKETDPLLVAPQYASLHQCGRIDRGANIELAGVDRRLHAADIDLAKPAREWRVPKAALGQPPMERHLATLEALDPHARARGLALAAAAAGLAAARADATPNAMALLARAGPVGEF